MILDVILGAKNKGFSFLFSSYFCLDKNQGFAKFENNNNNKVIKGSGKGIEAVGRNPSLDSEEPFK